MAVCACVCVCLCLCLYRFVCGHCEGIDLCEGIVVCGVVCGLCARTLVLTAVPSTHNAQHKYTHVRVLCALARVRALRLPAMRSTIRHTSKDVGTDTSTHIHAHIDTHRLAYMCEHPRKH